MIKLRNLNLEALDYSKNGHYSIVRKLNEDQGVYNYVSKHFDTWIKEPTTDDKYEIGKAYIITTQENEKIGICGSTTMDAQRTIDFWIAIDKSQRNKNYAEKTLVQVTEYFLENIENLKDIKLVINKRNESSNRVALKSGYTITNTDIDSNSDINTYRYFGK